MGKDVDPWIYCPYSPWRFGSFNCASSLRQPAAGRQSTNSMMFPSYFNPYGCASSGNAAPPFPVFQAQRTLPKAPALIPPSGHTYGLTGFTDPQKRFLVFDHSGDQTSLIFSSSGTPFASPISMNPAPDMQGSNETNVSDGHGGEEMHEDTEEIDALLYSDSDDDDDDDDEAASTGHSPVIKMAAETAEEVASSTVPAKRRRFDLELDASLVDTASSAVADRYQDLCSDYRNKDTSDDAESSCVRGGEKRRLVEEEAETQSGSNHGIKRLKRARIQETVGVLRRIIPGGKGKDAATVLDEAIRYLRTLKLKAKALGATRL